MPMNTVRPLGSSAKRGAAGVPEEEGGDDSLANEPRRLGCRTVFERTLATRCSLDLVLRHGEALGQQQQEPGRSQRAVRSTVCCDPPPGGPSSAILAALATRCSLDRVLRHVPEQPSEQGAHLLATRCSLDRVLRHPGPLVAVDHGLATRCSLDCVLRHAADGEVAVHGLATRCSLDRVLRHTVGDIPTFPSYASQRAARSTVCCDRRTVQGGSVIDASRNALFARPCVATHGCRGGFARNALFAQPCVATTIWLASSSSGDALLATRCR